MDRVITRKVKDGRNVRVYGLFTCEYCGKEYETRVDQHNHYCSRECYYESMKGETTYPHICKYCGREYRNIKRDSTYCSIQCKNKARLGSNHPLWKGGMTIDDGYRKVLSGNGGYVKEHRKVVEAVIGRKLRTDEIIHHINVNRSDNRIENLALLTKSEHSIIHQYLRGHGHMSYEEYNNILRQGQERITKCGK